MYIRVELHFTRDSEYAGAHVHLHHVTKVQVYAITRVIQYYFDGHKNPLIIKMEDLQETAEYPEGENNHPHWEEQ